MVAARRFAMLASAALGAAFGAGSVPAASPAPAVGRHDAEMCVATLPKAASCGPANVDVRTDGSIRVRIDDVVYSLRLHSSQVSVVVMHNVVQIDEFTAPYEWAGRSLTFADDERRARYELRFGSQRR
jgi:uncharacterized protein YdeI (BOF family)